MPSCIALLHPVLTCLAVACLQDVLNFIIVVVICVVMSAMMLCTVFGPRVAAVTSPTAAISQIFQCEACTC